MKILLLIASLSLLTSCGPGSSPNSKCPYQPSTNYVTKYVVLNPKFIGKCFKQLDQADILVTDLKDNGYEVSIIQTIKSYRTGNPMVVAIPSDYTRIMMYDADVVKCPKFN